MPKVAILKTHHTEIYSIDGYVCNHITEMVEESDFEEISEKELAMAKECINYASDKCGDFHYILIEKSSFSEAQQSFEEILNEIKTIKEKEDIKRLKSIEAELKYQTKRKAAELARKKKMLDKLKKELECPQD